MYKAASTERGKEYHTDLSIIKKNMQMAVFISYLQREKAKESKLCYLNAINIFSKKWKLVQQDFPLLY